MLPFLEPKKMSSVIIAKRGKTDLHQADESLAPESEMDPGLHEAAQDILRAIDAKSSIDLAKAIKAAFEICDSYPHEEGEHTEGEL